MSTVERPDIEGILMVSADMAEEAARVEKAEDEGRKIWSNQEIVSLFHTTCSADAVNDLSAYALQLEQRVKELEASPGIVGLSVLADIREAPGVGAKPMLSELPGIVRGLVTSQARAEGAVEELKQRVLDLGTENSHLRQVERTKDILEARLIKHNATLRKVAEAAAERGGCFVEQALQAAREAGALKEGE